MPNFYRFKYKYEDKVKLVRGGEGEVAYFTKTNIHRNIYEPIDEKIEFDTKI